MDKLLPHPDNYASTSSNPNHNSNLLAPTDDTRPGIVSLSPESIAHSYNTTQERLAASIPGGRSLEVNPRQVKMAHLFTEREAAKRKGPSGLDRFLSLWSQKAVKENLKRSNEGKVDKHSKSSDEALKLSTYGTVTSEENPSPPPPPPETNVKRKDVDAEVSVAQSSGNQTMDLFSNITRSEWSQEEIERISLFAKQWDPRNRNKKRRKKRQVVPCSPSRRAKKEGVDGVDSAGITTNDNGNDVKPEEEKEV